MEHKGTVYFFTGLSGAGKTTVGSLFYQRLKNTKPNAVYLDGDEIRVAFGEDVGYTNDERLRWAGRIFRVCKLLSDQGDEFFALLCPECGMPTGNLAHGREFEISWVEWAKD